MIGDLKVQKRYWFKHLIGGSVTVFCLFVFARQVNVSGVIDALADFDWVYLVLGVASLAFGYMLRIVRWSMMLRAAGANATFRDCSGPFLGSIALNNILPLRLGDVVRALVFPKSMKITRTCAMSSLIVERQIDLATLLVSLAIGLFAIQKNSIPTEVIVTAISLSIFGGLSLTFGFLFSGTLSRLFTRLAARSLNYKKRVYQSIGDVLHGFDVMLRPRLLMSMLTISMFVWAGEAGLFFFVLCGAGVNSSPLVALLVMAVATLSTLAPSSPGYVGPFHLAAFTAISLAGGTTEQAGSYAVIVHLALWLPTTLAGSLAIWMRPALFRAAKGQTV